MLKTLAVVIAGLGLALAGQSTATPQAPKQASTQGPPTAAIPAPGTSALTGQIMQRLTDDPVLQNYAITASVGADGVASLNGVVPSQALNQRAIDSVKAVPGVSKVVSNILVNVDPFAPKPAAAINAPPSGQVVPPPPPAAEAPQAKLADALAQHQDLARVLAHVYDDKVMIIGTVTNPQAKQEAERITKQIIPNLTITNLIWVDPHPIAPPPLVPATPSPRGGGA